MKYLFYLADEMYYRQLKRCSLILILLCVPFINLMAKSVLQYDDKHLMLLDQEQHLVFMIDTESPNSVTTIGMSAFGFCIKLKDITLPESLKFIRSNAFYFCTAMEIVKLPSTIEAIGDMSDGMNC